MSVSRTSFTAFGSAAGSSGSTTIAGASAAIADMLRDLDDFNDADMIGLARESLNKTAMNQRKINLLDTVSKLHKIPVEIPSVKWESNEQTCQIVQAAALCSKAVYQKAVNGKVSSETLPKLSNYTVKDRQWTEPARDGSRKAACLFEITPDNQPSRRTILVLAVRGSAGLFDWLVNFNSSLVTCQDLINLPDPRSMPKVHSGFAHCAKTLAPIVLGHIEAALDEFQSQDRDIEIVFTGHSAGGAVSSLLFCYFSTFKVLATRPVMPILSCITFGSPPILTEDIYLLANQFPANNIILSGTFLAFVNDGDPIPRMDESYAKKLASIWHSVGGSRPKKAEDLGEFVPPALSLNCLGHIVLLFDRNAGSEEEEEKLMACHLDHRQLEQRAWANIWAHDIDQYVEWTALLGNSLFNR